MGHAPGRKMKRDPSSLRSLGMTILAGWSAADGEFGGDRLVAFVLDSQIPRAPFAPAHQPRKSAYGLPTTRSIGYSFIGPSTFLNAIAGKMYAFAFASHR